MKKEKVILTLLDLDPDVIARLDKFIINQGWVGNVQKLQIYVNRQIPEDYRERMRLSLNEYGDYLKDKKYPTEGWLRAKFFLVGCTKPVTIWFYGNRWGKTA